MANDTSSIIKQVTEITKQVENLTASIQLSTKEICSAFEEVGEILVGSLCAIFDNIITYMDTLVNQANAIQENLGAMWASEQAVGFGDVVNGLVSGLEILAATLGIVTGLMTIFGETSAGAAISLAATTIATWAQQAATAAMNIVQAILNGLLAISPLGWIAIAIGGVVTALVLLWQNCEPFQEFIMGMFDKIGTIAQSVLNALVIFFTETIPTALAPLMDLFAAFGEFWKGIWEQISVFFSTCWDAIVLFFTETLPGALETAMNFFAELPGKIWEFLSQAVSKLGEWASGLISKAGEVLPGVISSVLGFFSGLPDNMREVGKNLIEGIFNGISNSVQWLYEKLKGWAGNVIDYIKDLFDINSPSKVMRDTVGVGIAEGVAVGISENTDLVRDAMSEIADVVADSDISVEPEVKATSIDFEAFKEKIRPSLDFVKSQISKAQDVLNTQFAASLQLAGAMAGANNTYNNGNTFNNHYTITAANNSPKATADAIKNQMTMQRMLFATR